MKSITGTHYAYFHLCHRKLWLFHHGIQMEQESTLVQEGKMIEEQSYDRRSERWQQVQIEAVKVDYYDPKKRIIREVKKSSKMEHTHIEQVKYYMYIFLKNDIDVESAILEYPKLRDTQTIQVQDMDSDEIETKLERIHEIISREHCPALRQKPICRKCAYYEFCYVTEAL